MSTAVATAPPPSSLNSTPPDSTSTPAVDRAVNSPRHFAPPPPTSAPPAELTRPPRTNASPAASSVDNAPGSAEKPADSEDKTSPDSRSTRNPIPHPIKVKKEPGSPSIASSRPRPKRLDLTASSSRGPQTARPSAPLTARDSAGLAIQDVGLACLSPGFQTNDPSMREQLQRSLDVRDQQRQIIEARQKGTKPGSSHGNDGSREGQDTTLFGVQTRTPSTSKRKGPPPALSIGAPNAAQFASDRVIQSAPLNQTFTGLRPGDQPYSRHAQHGASGLSQMSHIHHVPATQTNNRLPPIADVFANDRLDVQRNHPSNNSPPQPPPVPSPGFANHSSHQHPPPPTQHAYAQPQHQQPQPPNPPPSSRGREFRSAEEAVAGLSGGRDDLMPKVVHYGGVQPPTPPSPMPPHNHNHNHHPHHNSAYATVPGAAQHHAHPATHLHQPPHTARPDLLSRTSSATGRRRARDEFERDHGSPPLPPHSSGGHGNKRAAFAVRGEDAAGAEEREADREREWRGRMSAAEKRDEFMRLCARAWDLLHE